VVTTTGWSEQGILMAEDAGFEAIGKSGAGVNMVWSTHGNPKADSVVEKLRKEVMGGVTKKGWEDKYASEDWRGRVLHPWDDLQRGIDALDISAQG